MSHEFYNNNYFVCLSFDLMMITGKYYKLPLIDMHKQMNAEYGSLVLFPGMFGRPQMAMSYNVEDVEKVSINKQLNDIIN